MSFAEENIRWALDRGEFVPYFQPLVDLRSGSIHGFEILARWNHPTRGLVPPSRFIPLVEGFALINELSVSLLNQAFTVARTLPTNFGFSVNFSPAQLHDRTLPNILQRMAEESGFDLKRLTVELTESALVDDLKLAGAVAADFKSLGTRLALDDFGTGYSSLLHLQSLPFDELKVDISFVRSMVHSRQSRKITAAVVGLGISLGLQTVAEGVEVQAQADLLMRQGCTLGQGLLYGGPVPAVELAEALSRKHTGVGATISPSPSLSERSLEARPLEPLSQLRAIYDSAPVGLAFLDCELRYVNINQRLAEMNGRSVEVHLGRTVSEVLPELYSAIEPYLKRALAGETIPSFEVERAPLEAGESVIRMLAFYSPVRDEAGEILGVSVSVVDISGVRLKEEALRESEENYRHAAELNPQAPWVMDAAGNNIYCSPRWEAMTGFTAEQTKNHGWLDALHPDDRQRIVEEIEVSLRTGCPMDLEYRVRDEHGVWTWMRSRGAPRRNEAGEIIRWYGSVESIDDHKRALDELRSSEARLRAIFEAAPVGIVLAESSSGKVLSANPRAEHLLGFHFKKDMIWTEEPWKAFDSQEQLIEVSNFPLTRAMNSGEHTEAQELLLHRSDGSEIWLSATAAPICFENGDLLGGVLVVQDIDNAKHERRSLLELVRELSLIVSKAAGISRSKVV